MELKSFLLIQWHEAGNSTIARIRLLFSPSLHNALCPLELWEANVSLCFLIEHRQLSCHNRTRFRGYETHRGAVVKINVTTTGMFSLARRNKDSPFHCLTVGALCPAGPAEVPMMSPNGSIPPIHVPPGYISQVSRVSVLPASILLLSKYSLYASSVFLLKFFPQPRKK